VALKALGRFELRPVLVLEDDFKGGPVVGGQDIVAVSVPA
jgi:hypothetical protein